MFRWLKIIHFKPENMDTQYKYQPVCLEELEKLTLEVMMMIQKQIIRLQEPPHFLNPQLQDKASY